MRLSIYIFLWCWNVLGVPLLLSAASTDEYFAQANNAYKAGQYEQAIALYSKARAQGKESAALYYNLGNAHYKSNHIALAILNYERAVKLNPEDDDAQHNLRLANSKITDRVQRVPQLAIVSGWQNFVRSRSAKTWAWYSIALLWMALLCFAAYLFVGSIRRIGFYLGILFLLVTGFTTYLGFVQHHYEENSGEAILTATNTTVKSAPDENSTDIFMLHEGVKMEVQDQVSDWIKIRLADGKVGWVKRDALERI